MLVNLIKVNDVEKIREALCKLENSVRNITKYLQIENCQKYAMVINEQIESLTNTNKDELFDLSSELLSILQILRFKRLNLSEKDA